MAAKPPSWIWRNHSNRRPRKPHHRTKHEVDRITSHGDMAIWNFPKCEVAGRSSIYTSSYTVLIYSSLLRQERSARGVKILQYYKSTSKQSIWLYRKLPKAINLFAGQLQVHAWLFVLDPTQFTCPDPVTELFLTLTSSSVSGKFHFVTHHFLLCWL